jgi:hypothetical protein
MGALARSTKMGGKPCGIALSGSPGLVGRIFRCGTRRVRRHGLRPPGRWLRALQFRDEVVQAVVADARAG